MLDYGSGNVRSAVRALQRLGADVKLSADPSAAIEADGLVVPGVGAFAACMAGLRDVQAPRILTERLEAGRPVLGICVGMQVLYSAGLEHGIQTPGLGLLAGKVEPLHAPVIPHMGWNTVRPPADSTLFAGLDDSTRFYFVHSYAVHPQHPPDPQQPPDPPDPPDPQRPLDPQQPPDPQRPQRPGGGPAVTLAEHGELFVAAVEADLLSATQFHPEKSGNAGAQLLRNWLESL